MIALITKINGIDIFMGLVKWPKIAVKKAKFFRNFRNKSRSILMLHKIDKKKVAPKLIFFNERRLKKLIFLSNHHGKSTE